jgi:hypothetical protein
MLKSRHLFVGTQIYAYLCITKITKDKHYDDYQHFKKRKINTIF